MWKLTFYYGVLDLEKSASYVAQGFQIVIVVFVFFVKFLF